MTYIKAATLVLVASIYGGGNVQCEQAIPFASTLFERRSLQHRLEKQHAELCARNVAACREFRGYDPDLDRQEMGILQDLDEIDVEMAQLPEELDIDAGNAWSELRDKRHTLERDLHGVRSEMRLQESGSVS